MDFTYTEEQLAVQSMVERFVRKEIAPKAAEIDRTGEFPYDIYRKLGELGIIGMTFPPEAGGTGADFLSFCLAVEEIARADAGFGPTLTAQLSACRCILRFAREPQRKTWIEKYVKPIARGEATGSTAATEADHSSFDSAATKTVAVLDGKEYVINGHKIFCTAAGLENNLFVIVWAITDRAKRTLDALLVPRGTPGYTIGRKLPKMGMRSSDTRELFFDNCRVPVENLLGVGRASENKERSDLRFHSRLLLASNAIGLHRFCLEEALAFAKTRISWGQPISQRQLIQGWLAEMATDLELSRLLRDRCAWRFQRGEMTGKEGSMLKYYCAESAAKAANYAAEIFGGMGFIDDVAVARRYRDAKGLTLIQSSSPIHKWMIAKELGC